jgi:hypothetical protein
MEIYLETKYAIVKAKFLLVCVNFFGKIEFLKFKRIISII